MFRGFAGSLGPMVSGGLRGALSGVRGIASGIGGALSGAIQGALAALGVGGVASLGGLILGLKGAVDLGGELNDEFDRTGIAVKDLVVLREQFRQGGVGAGAVTNYVRKMNEAIGDTKTKGNLFKGLGLDQAKLKGKSAFEAFNDITQAVAKLGNTADKQEALSGIFGARTGTSLLPIVNDPNSAKSAKATVGMKMPQTLDNMSGRFDFVSDMWDALPTKFSQLFVAIASEMIGPLEVAAEWIRDLDLSDFGARVGQSLLAAWRVTEAAIKNPEAAIAGLSSKMIAALQASAAYFLGAIAVGPAIVFEGFKSIMMPLAKMLIEVFKVAGNAIGIGAIEAMTNIREMLPDSLKGVFDGLEWANAKIKDATGLGALKKMVTGTNFSDDYNAPKIGGENAAVTRQKAQMSKAIEGAGEEFLNAVTGVFDVVQVARSKFKPDTKMLEEAKKSSAKGDGAWAPFYEAAKLPPKVSLFDRYDKEAARTTTVDMANNKIIAKGPSPATAMQGQRPSPLFDKYMHPKADKLSEKEKAKKKEENFSGPSAERLVKNTDYLPQIADALIIE